MAFSAGARRVGTARWLEPVVEIRADGNDSTFRYDRVVLQQLDFDGEALCNSIPDESTAGIFDARKSGQLFLFLNDVALPGLRPDLFYDGYERGQNSGTARIRVYSAAEMAGRRKECPARLRE